MYNGIGEIKSNLMKLDMTMLAKFLKCVYFSHWYLLFWAFVTLFCVNVEYGLIKNVNLINDHNHESKQQLHHLYKQFN